MMATPDALNTADLGGSYVKLAHAAPRDETFVTVSSAFHHPDVSALDRARQRWRSAAIVQKWRRR